MNLMTSNDLLNVDLRKLRDYVRRGLVRPTAITHTPRRGYLWSPEDAAEIYRIRDLEAVRLANRREYAAIRQKSGMVAA